MGSFEAHIYSVFDRSAVFCLLPTQDCEGPAAGGDCDVCVRLNIECLRGYGERLPVEYRVRVVLNPLSF